MNLNSFSLRDGKQNNKFENRRVEKKTARNVLYFIDKMI